MKYVLIVLPSFVPAGSCGVFRRAFGIFVYLAVYLALGIGCRSVFAQPAPQPVKFTIVLHGGAGLEPEKLTAAEKEEHHASLKKALEVGRNILADGGAALDAVEQTVRALEDDPLYNAGRGAVFNSKGQHELDASIMDGATGQGGAVAAVTTIKNPISLARLVMTETPHVLLIGAGAEAFADEMRDRKQIVRVSNSYFSTDHRRREWEEELKRIKQAPPAKTHRGTVGCVALDQHGNLAAGTSTGGLTNKKFGRVGDTPILGAGTYAANDTCAVSCTGTGEYFIRHSIAFHVSALMTYKGLSVDEAVRHVIEKVLPVDIGGVIALDRQGSISMRFNTAGMPRAWADSSGKLVTKLGPDDPGQALFPIGAGRMELKIGARQTPIEVFTYKPAGYTDGPMVIVCHGVLRNAEDYRNDAEKMGDRFGALIVAPRFSLESFPFDSYQLGGVIHDGRAVSRDEWTFNRIPEIAAEIRRREARPNLRYYLFGHSGGGQFLGRLSAFIDPHAVRIVVSNPGTYLAPTRAASFPYGFGGLPDDISGDQAIRKYLAQPMTLYLGTGDTKADEYFEQAAEAMAQGASRIERGRKMFEFGRKLAHERGWAFHWRLVEAPDIGHDHEQMLNHAKCEEALFGPTADK